MAKVTKRKQNLIVTCRYCEYFFLSPAEDERSKIKERRCAIINELVTTLSNPCSSFKPDKSFWCDKDNHWQYRTACEARIARMVINCKKCKQGKIILKIRDEYDG
uniref:Uncharacterized protein n=1 Tax=viral metagenome TaxID=1070528 RepID=A0A6M3XU37_9ZZZZ